MVVRPRRFFPTCLLSAVLILGGLHAAPAQNNSLFPKGGPNRTLPQTTPLPRGATRSDSAASSSARRRPAPPPRPDTVSLPYNLVWFDSQNRLASLFAGVGAKITDKKTEGPNEVWSVKDLIAPNLRTSFFTFQQGLLIGLEFDYGQDAWDTDKYNEVMGQFRRLLETKCEGPGEIISRKTDQAPGSAIKETLMGYQWARGDTSVQLFYYSAEDTAKALNFRSISVHYHYRDPFAPPPGSEQPLPPAAPSPGGQTASVTVTPNGPDNSPGGALPLPDNTAAGATKPGPAPGPSPASAVTDASSAPPAQTDDGLPGPESVGISEEEADANSAAAPAPSASPTPTPTPAPTPTATPTPTPTPKKSASGRRRRG